MEQYRIELVWNREFDWSYYKRDDDLDHAKKVAKGIRDSGDGARVKKVRIVDNETDEVVWNG